MQTNHEIEFQEGARVRIRPDSKHYGTGINNPSDDTGTVVIARNRTFFPLFIEWDNGTDNSYHHNDLMYAPFSKQDLQDDDVVTYRKGWVRVVRGARVVRPEGVGGQPLADFTRGLELPNTNGALDIVRIQRNGSIIWEREGANTPESEVPPKDKELKVLL